ncbi:MAG TPA: hypothetical protein VHF23_05150 [Gaiellaceae bacterium]|nr:hypothetical protein [Gaiellaceae bacterium]
MSEDTFSVESSAGPMHVEFGWDGWVAVTVPRSNGASHAARRIVESRHDLEGVLLGFGLPESEAARIAGALWRQRPADAPEKEPGREPAYDGGLLVLVGALALGAGGVLLASMAGLF